MPVWVVEVLGESQFFFGLFGWKSPGQNRFLFTATNNEYPSSNKVSPVNNLSRSPVPVAARSKA